MKYRKLLYITLGAALFASCSDINDITTKGDGLTESQLNQSILTDSTRLNSALNGIFTMAVKPGVVTSADNDGALFTVMLSSDLNGPDMSSIAAGYNWYAISSQLNDAGGTRAINAISYRACYNVIGAANDLLRRVVPRAESANKNALMGNAKAMRAYTYLLLVNRHQLSYQVDRNALGVVLVDENTTNTTSNPRQTVDSVYKFILKDLNEARTMLEGYSRPDKRYIDVSVVDGLLARTHLAMGNYAQAAQFAQAAIDATSATPASISDVSRPAFCNASAENNWMWGGIVSEDVSGNQTLATTNDQLSSFPGYGYTASAGCYKDINVLLYNKIPSTDVRKEWWIAPAAENSVAPAASNSHLNGLTWSEAGQTLRGNEIISGTLESKVPFRAFTNVKFGNKQGIGVVKYDNDIPFMRVEEMYLIRAEALAMSGNLSEGRTVLENFVKTYRNPAYTVTASSAEAFQNEVWFQRRVELWGEGFSMYDILRLQKPVVRFHEGAFSNFPAAFRFNVPANDPVFVKQIDQRELDNNSAVVDNVASARPASLDNPTLRDGVTD